MPRSRPFGLLYDRRILAHDTGDIRVTLPDGSIFEPVDHFSSAAITGRIAALLQRSGLVDRCMPLAARTATIDELTTLHNREYIAHVEDVCLRGGGLLPDGTPVSTGSYLAAVLTAGGAIVATDAILDGEVGGAYVLARPPGHHALADRDMGYCIFNNVAVAALHARRRGLARVMIVDWDVHHGNGTQAAFYADPSVLFISLHQDDWYPTGSGRLVEQGEGSGEGYTLNIPLPAGTGDRGYLAAITTIVAPAARRFRPELIIVSAGQDASIFDPLGKMLVSMQGFREMGAAMRDLANQICDGRLLVVQEGGYSLPYTPFCTLGALEGIMESITGVPDAYATVSEMAQARGALSEATQQSLERARHTHHRYLGG